jgi:uncharacterized protein
MMKLLPKLFGFLGILTLFLTPLVLAQSKPWESISPTGYVFDGANVLDTASEQTLYAKAESVDKAGYGQIAVITIKNLEGYDIAEYSTNLFRKIGIGDKQKNNGVLVLLSIEDRKGFIATGSGVEGVIVDFQAANLVKEQRTFFQAGNYGQGLSAILDGVEKLLQKDPPTVKRLSAGKPSSNWWEWMIYALFFIAPVLSVIGSIFARSKSWWAGGLVGAGIGGIVSIFTPFLWIGLGSLLGLTILGLFLDYFVSKNYVEGRPQDHIGMWAGGNNHYWFDSSSGSGGGGFGGFGGGSSSGGGGGSSW